jgi:isopentenyl-diphosphate Delta-isomerase
MNESMVILVDTKDNQIGVIEKMDAHRQGLLHRAISVFIVDSEWKWILQRRAHDKYHSMGLWTNTCCTHPGPGESNMNAANRRLLQEMGLSCKLEELFTFVYKEKMDNELTENEFDHVFFGISDRDPVINASEVDDWKRISFKELQLDIQNNPDSYTYWFKKVYQEVHTHLAQHKTPSLL